jgi:diguanylate cyclase (GGDEF)-like protein
MMVQPDTRATTSSQRFASRAAAAVLLIGSIVLVGQVLSIRASRRVTAELGSVRTTTLLVLLSGLALWLTVGRSDSFRRWCARLCAALMVTAGALALIAVLDGAFGAGGRIGGAIAAVQTVFGGALPANAALGFAALGAALLLLDVETSGGSRPSQILATFAVLSSLVAVIGHAYGAEPLYDLASSPPLPFYEAVSFGVLGAGILAVSPDSSFVRLISGDSAGGRVIRYLAAALIVGLLVFGWLALGLQRALAWEVSLTLSVFVVLNTALVGLVTVAVADSLNRAEGRRLGVEQATRAKAALAEKANDQLRRSVAELERQTREISLLNDMSDLLHSSVTIAEASEIVVQFASKLFPNDAGALCLLSDNVIEAAGTWGGLTPEECLFKPSDCWALRRGRVHVSDEAIAAGDDQMAGLRCPHLATPWPAFSICVPMMAQNETLGLLHVRHAAVPPEVEGRAPASLSDARRRLAVTLAEHVALAIANLKLRETLRRQSIRDQLTGLLNRRYMEESLDRELMRASRSQSPLGLVLLDVDRLKQVNDTFGHEAGDRLLQTVSRFLQRRTRADDVLCRLGGDEFVIVMPGASLTIARDRAEQLLTEFRRVAIDFSSQGEAAPSLSMGLTVFPEHAQTGAGLLRAADLALYRAKAEGRDQLAIGQPTE